MELKYTHNGMNFHLLLQLASWIKDEWTFEPICGMFFLLHRQGRR